MNKEFKLHKYQVEILEKLNLTHSLRFNDLIIKDIESEHTNYHLKRLVEESFVLKGTKGYSLTDKGKDYVNSLDEETKIVEKQPKTSVIIYGVRQNKTTGLVEFLVNKRLEQPYFGKVGRIGGKVRFGETFLEAAKRELLEETGLIAENYTLEKIYRKIRKRPDGTIVQDVIFYIYFVMNFSGELIQKNRYQENFWISKTDLYNNKELDPFDDLVLEDRLEPFKFIIEENINVAEGY